MFCSNCGCELNDNSLFCHKCGQPIHNTNNFDDYPYSSPAELDHEALIIYLKDILSLECIRHQYIDNINEINRKLQNTSSQYYKKIYTIKAEERQYWNPIGGSFSFHFLFQNNHFYVAGINSINGFAPGSLYKNSTYLSIDENYSYFSSLSPWTKTEIGYGSGIKRIKSGKEARGLFLRCYEDFKNTALAGLNSNKNTIAFLTQKRDGIFNELKSVNMLIKKAYNINIIPIQFRDNIYAIYYLYNFISSSNQSLTTALLHFDLNEIKIKLAKIIEQQKDIIIQQSIIQSQNHQLIEQNQQHLKKLASIERSAAQSALYSEIAANNAEACAWIGLANYIKNS